MQRRASRTPGATTIVRTFRDKLFTEIFPGHGAGSLCGKAIGSRASSTLGYERRFNVALVEKPEEEE